MKEFDLDKLERKNIYKTPERFFEEVQENVLKQTINKEKKTSKVLRLNFSVVTSIAATIVLVFGFTFLWKTDQADITSTADMDSLSKINKPKTEKGVSDRKEITPISNLHDGNIGIKTKSNMIVKTQKTKKTEAKNNEVNYEQLLNSLSDDELKELSKNADQDIYLELFN